MISTHCNALKGATGSARRAKMDLFGLFENENQAQLMGIRGYFVSETDKYPSTSTFKVYPAGIFASLTVLWLRSADSIEGVDGVLSNINKATSFTNNVITLISLYKLITR